MAARVTGRIQIGRFVLEVGAPEGMRADLATVAGGADPGELALALSQPAPTEVIRAGEPSRAEAESVTPRVERALEVFTTFAQGRIDRGTALAEADELVGELERLDRERRPADALRLARALAGLLALLMRWVALVQAIRIARKAAVALGDRAGEAWARHELGTLWLGAENAQAASSELEQARWIRAELGDDAGVRATDHNLATARSAFGAPTGSGWSKPMIVAAVIGGILLVGAVGAGIAILVTRGNDTGADTTAPVVTFDKTPDNPTEERSATFEFSADEDVDRFECSLDGKAFQECSSPRNIAGPLGFREHSFSVRAVDLAGNRGDAKTFRWTVERGQGPTVTITSGPNSPTNQTTATFEMSAPDAVRLECRLDGGAFDTCSSPNTLSVGEGDHLFVARGVDAAGTTGPEAAYEWTVDTTPPTVQIDSADRTSDSKAEVTFTISESETDVVCNLFQSSDLQNPVDEKTNCTSPVDFTGLDAASTYVVRITAEDSAGNTSQPATANIPTFSGP
jgi:hypothetical protein